jgi:hypothetical protein
VFGRRLGGAEEVPTVPRSSFGPALGTSSAPRSTIIRLPRTVPRSARYKWRVGRRRGPETWGPAGLPGKKFGIAILAPRTDPPGGQRRLRIAWRGVDAIAKPARPAAALSGEPIPGRLVRSLAGDLAGWEPTWSATGTGMQLYWVKLLHHL